MSVSSNVFLAVCDYSSMSNFSDNDSLLDLNAVHVDDELLDLISRGYPSDEELAQLLSSWCIELSKSPRELVDLNTACDVLMASRTSWRWWTRVTQTIWHVLFVLVVVVSLSIALGG